MREMRLLYNRTGVRFPFQLLFAAFCTTNLSKSKDSLRAKELQRRRQQAQGGPWRTNFRVRTRSSPLLPKKWQVVCDQIRRSRFASKSRVQSQTQCVEPELSELEFEEGLASQSSVKRVSRISLVDFWGLLCYV